MKYIAICGTVGSGKTTMLGKLLDHFGARASFHEERPQDNPFICDYYADSKRWTFHAQVSFLSLYFDDPAWKPGNGETELFFFDRCFLENLVIARYRLDQGDLTQAEFDVLEKLATGIGSLMPKQKQSYRKWVRIKSICTNQEKPNRWILLPASARHLKYRR